MKSIICENVGSLINISGTLRIINSNSDINKIQPGEIIYLRLQGDLLTSVVKCIDKNAVAFIANCGSTDHGVIAAKELGTAFYITDFKKFINNQPYTLYNNSIIKGIYQFKQQFSSEKIYHKLTKTKLFINLGFPKRIISRHSQICNYVDGVGFARLEFVILEIIGKLHPISYILKYNADNFINKIVEHFGYAVQYFSGKRFWIRTDDFSPNQLYKLSGGEKYEQPTTNELVGFRGISRAVDEKWSDLGNFSRSLTGISWIDLQFRSINILTKKFPKVKFGVFAPMVHDISEYIHWQKLAKQSITADIDYGLMVEVPAVSGDGLLPFLKKKLIKFVIFGSNDLTALTLGLDRSDIRFRRLFNEENPVVLDLMRKTIDHCCYHNILTAIGGAAASKPTLMKRLYDFGIDIFSISPNINTITECRKLLYKLENKK